MRKHIWAAIQIHCRRFFFSLIRCSTHISSLAVWPLMMVAPLYYSTVRPRTRHASIIILLAYCKLCGIYHSESTAFKRINIWKVTEFFRRSFCVSSVTVQRRIRLWAGFIFLYIFLGYKLPQYIDGIAIEKNKKESISWRMVNSTLSISSSSPNRIWSKINCDLISLVTTITWRLKSMRTNCLPLLLYGWLIFIG